MTHFSRLAIAAAIAAFGAVSAVPATAAVTGKGYLVDNVDIDAGQKMRLNVVLLEPAPRNCRVMLSIFNGKGEQVRHHGPVSLDRGSSTHIQMQGPGHYRAFVRVADRRCESAVKADVEVF
jgi:hypothetical protein